MTDSYIVHLDQADVTEILGALDAATPEDSRTLAVR